MEMAAEWRGCNARSSVRLRGEFRAVSVVFDALVSLELKGRKFSVFFGWS